MRVTVALLSLLMIAWASLFEPSWVRFFEQPITFWPDEPGYTRYISHEREWTLRFPESWHAFNITERPLRQMRHGLPSTFGVFISNVKVEEKEVWADGMPANLVAVRVAYYHPGGALFEGFCDHDTALPLRLSNAASSNAQVGDDVGGAVRAFWLPFAIGRYALYSVRAWVGSKASDVDRAAAESIVESIHYSNESTHVSAGGCPIEDQLRKLGGKVS